MRSSVYVKSYSDAASLYVTARDKKKGKPLTSGSRLIMDADNTFVVTVYDHQFLRIHPDNRFEFLLDGEHCRGISNTLCATLHTICNFTWQRVATGRYRVEYQTYAKRDKSPEVFAGLTFDMDGKQWLNPRPDLVKSIDKNKRTEWLRARKKFLQGIAVRHKLGVFEAIKHEFTASNTVYQAVPSHLEYAEMVYAAMRDETFNPELLRAITAYQLSRTWVQYWSAPMKSLPTEVRTFIDNNSIQLRRKFGVFNQE